ncbi:hypothetical protein HK102_011115, partial [Quaeritorhiza haematococci]
MRKAREWSSGLKRSGSMDALLGGGSLPVSLSAPKSDLDSLATKFSHLFFEFKACVASVCSPGESAELSFFLYNRVEARSISEEYRVVLTSNGVPKDGRRRGTLFVDLGFRDLSDNVWLVCRIVRVGRMNVSDREGVLGTSSGGTGRGEKFLNGLVMSGGSSGGGGGSSGPTLRRPFGYAVFELGDILLGRDGGSAPVVGGSSSGGGGDGGSGGVGAKSGIGGSGTSSVASTGASNSTSTSSGTVVLTAPLRDYPMKIYVPTAESHFPTLHEHIIDRITSSTGTGGGITTTGNPPFETSPRAEHVSVSLKLFHGDATHIIRQHSGLLKDASVTPRNGFSDVILPGDSRNAMYLTIGSGEFIQGRKTSARNIEVS